MSAFAFGGIYPTDSNQPLRITISMPDSIILRRIISGKSRGLSPTYKIKGWECSICHEEYKLCPHETGMKYDDAECYTIAKKVESTFRLL